MRALVATGTGRYADPWHPYPQTSPLIASILEGDGFEVQLTSDVDRAMAALDKVDLLVVNAGDPWRNSDGGVDAALQAEGIHGFQAALDRGIGILAVHSATASLRDYPEWATTVGAVWLPGVSMHPPADVATIEVVDAAFAQAGNERFEVFDERYCGLQQLGRRHVVAWHHADGAHHPTAWIREAGRSRVAVDLLGHDERSYESAGRRALLSHLAGWAVELS